MKIFVNLLLSLVLWLVLFPLPTTEYSLHIFFGYMIGIMCVISLIAMCECDAYTPPANSNKELIPIFWMGMCFTSSFLALLFTADYQFTSMSLNQAPSNLSTMKQARFEFLVLGAIFEIFLYVMYQCCIVFAWNRKKLRGDLFKLSCISL